MIQEKIKLLKFFDHLVDLIIVSISVYLAVLCEQLYHYQKWSGFRSDSFDFLLLPVVLLIWSLLIQFIEKNTLYRTDAYLTRMIKVFLITLIGFISIVTFDFLLKQQLFYRSTIVFFAIISFSLLSFKRFSLKFFLTYIRSMGLDNKNIMILGCNQYTLRLINEIERHVEYGLLIKSIVDVEKSNKKIDKYKVIKEEEIYNDIFSVGIDEVFITLPIEQINQSTIKLFDNLGINYHPILDISKFSIYNNSTIPKVFQQYSFPMLTFQKKTVKLYMLYIKNIWERFFSFILGIVLLPIVLFFSILIKLDSKGPIIFKQKRIGLHGRKFTQYKLRSMVFNAEELKDNIKEDNMHSGPVFKSNSDPRITRVGKLLRKYSIDEIPQLYNVIKGDMNLIGPRPPIPEEVKKYKPHHYRRLSVKPGLTGLWQVSGRNSIENFDDWVRLDLDYIDNWSLGGDLMIVLKTIPVVIKGTGR